MLKKVIIPSLNHRKALFLLLTAGSLLLNAGCKDDEKILSGEPEDPSAIIPSKDKKYNYKVTDEDGTVSAQVVRVKSVSDSAGLTVFKLETRINTDDEDLVLDWKAYSKDGITTSEINTPAAFSVFLETIRDNENVKDFKLTGFPQFQHRENEAAVTSKLTFTGAPIKLYLKLEVDIDEGEKILIEVESTLTYTNGKAVKVESLTTPGGTFNCTKWEYRYDNLQKVSYHGKVQEQTIATYKVSEWTAPGVGLVKSIEDRDGHQSVTELQKIESTK
jgi:hypothetical protein